MHTEDSSCVSTDKAESHILSMHLSITRLLLGFFVCFEKRLLRSYFKAVEAVFGCTQLRDDWWLWSPVPLSVRRTWRAQRRCPSPEPSHAHTLVHHFFKRPGTGHFSHKPATLSPLCPSEAQGEGGAAARPPAMGAEGSQNVPAHIHCWKSLCSFCPCSQEFRVDSILFHSYLCQLYLISGIASAKEIPVVCVGWVCGPRRAHKGQCWPLAMDKQLPWDCSPA